MLRDALMAAGTPSDAIEVIPEEQAAVDAALRQARQGDLLLVFADAITRTWKQVIHFRPDSQEPTLPVAPSTPHRLVAADDFELATDADVPLIRDERGVRLAREEDD